MAASPGERLDPDDDQALVFTSPMGTPLRHSNFYRRAWLPAVARANLPGVHFHDLRHAGNTLTADAVGEAARAALLKTATPSGTHVARDASDQL